MRPRKSLKSIVNLLLLKSPFDLFFFITRNTAVVFMIILSTEFRKIKEALAFYLKKQYRCPGSLQQRYLYSVFFTE